MAVSIKLLYAWPYSVMKSICLPNLSFLFVERKYFYLFLVKHTCVSWRRGQNLFGLRGYTRAYKEFPRLQLTAIISYYLSRFWGNGGRMFIYLVFTCFSAVGVLLWKSFRIIVSIYLYVCVSLHQLQELQILMFKRVYYLGLSLLKNLYAGQEATVRTGHGATD